MWNTHSHEQSYLSYTVPWHYKAKSDNWKYVSTYYCYDFAPSLNCGFLCLVLRGCMFIIILSKFGLYCSSFSFIYNITLCFVLFFSEWDTVRFWILACYVVLSSSMCYSMSERQTKGRSLTLWATNYRAQKRPMICSDTHLNSHVDAGEKKLSCNVTGSWWTINM